MFAIPFLDVPPLAGVQGSVALPGSKSISNRVLLLAALAEGRTTVHDVLESDDTRVMLQALQQLGCTVRTTAPRTLVIDGLAGQLPVQTARLHLGNAGTAMRPLAAALAVLGGDFLLEGVARMHERPIGDLVDALRGIGCAVDYRGTEGFPPLAIGRPALSLGQPIRVRGDVSSQFLTALLMALPLATGAGPAAPGVVIEVEGELISKPYIAITLGLLARFGVAVRQDGWQRFTIAAGSRLVSPGAIHVEADASSASYFIAAGALSMLATGTKGLKIDGVGLDSIQGDIRFVDAARRMGAVVEGGANHLVVRPGRLPLAAIDIDCIAIPDAAMTLAAMALFADGPSTLRNIGSWRVKETDRIAAMAAEARKLGARVETGDDWLRISPPGFAAGPAQDDAAPGIGKAAAPSPAWGTEPHAGVSLGAGSAWRAAAIDTYDDHRIAMCFALAAFNPHGLPVRIHDPRCVGKTFPDFFETLFGVAVPAQPVPVICIDGPSASGKGTLASRVAAALGWHYLDSGALYRLVGVAARRAGLELDALHEPALAALARELPVRFDGEHVWLGDGDEVEDVGEAIRSEAAGMDASRVSALPAVRTALVALQHGFARLPGLVADGRDMGTVIFPAAALKVYLTASAAERAERRHKQLISKGFPAKLADLRADLESRDARDQTRSVAPLRPAEDALLLDNSQLSIDTSVDQVLAWWQARQPFALHPVSHPAQRG